MKLKLNALIKTIASSTTPEPLSSVRNASGFIKIRALSTNTGVVRIGDSATQAFPLAAGEELPLSEIMTASGGADELDLADIYCDVDVNGEGVAILIAKRP